jgi:hypothetical protein
VLLARGLDPQESNSAEQFQWPIIIQASKDGRLKTTRISAFALRIVTNNHFHFGL